MNSIFGKVKSSALELKNVKSMTIAAMLLALNILLFLFFSIQITNSLRLSFSYLPIAASGSLYGPVVGGIVAAAGDLLNLVIKPSGAFFPGFTINACLSGCIYGFVLYKKPASLKRTILARLCVALVELILGTLWLSTMYGKGYMVFFPARIMKAAILFPIEVMLLYGMLKVMERVKLPGLVR